jgi:glycosyltransferase involved in cell wall biosynthesis
MSVIEASSIELPVITSDIYGLNDCMLENITGLKFNHNIENDLYSKLEILINNKNLRRQFGEAGRSFIINNFKEEDVINFQLNFIYNKML